MINTKIKIADIIFSKMLLHNHISILPTVLKFVEMLKMEKNTDISNQIVSLAATLICMLHKYGLNHIDVLNTAENIIYSNDYNNIQPAFQAIMDGIQDKEEIYG